MSKARTFLDQIAERSDLITSELINAEWVKLWNFCKQVQEERSFFDNFYVTQSNDTYILMPKKSPINFDGFLMFKAKTTERYLGGYGHTVKTHMPVIILTFPDPNNRFMSVFPKYVGNWVGGKMHDFVHEYSHYLSDLKSSGKAGGSSSMLDKGDQSAYINHSDEINAYFREKVQWIFDRFRLIATVDQEQDWKQEMFHNMFGSDFNQFVSKFMTDHFEDVTPENRKRLIKRLYPVWRDLQKRYQEL